MPEIDFLSPPQSDDELGRLGAYRILKVLGQGGMGMVFKAEDPQLERIVALKVMLPAIAQRKEARDRFLREARAAAKLEHDHIIPIFQVGEDRGVPYIAMPFLKGMSVEDWLKKKGRFTIPQVLRLAREIAKGLQAAHERGLVHRDIKPANLWLDATTQGRIKILDFGLARPVKDDTQLTQDGAIVGTPAFMAPEQACGGAVDARSDLFSLGAVLYLLCTGQKPFAGANTLQILNALATTTPKPVRDLNPDMPPAFADLVMKLLEKDSANRPASAKAVVDAIVAIERERLRANSLTPPAASQVAAKTVSTPSQILKPDEDESKDSFIDERDLNEKTEAEEPPRKKKAKKRKSKGVPTWAWIAAGGGIAVLVLLITLVVALSGRGETQATLALASEDPAVWILLDGPDGAQMKFTAPVPHNVKIPPGTWKARLEAHVKNLKVEPTDVVVAAGETVKVEVKRVGDMVVPPPIKPRPPEKIPIVPANLHNTVDLLPLLDLQKDALTPNDWKLDGANLRGNSAISSRLQFPYQPPGEYDVAVDFTRLNGRDSVTVMLVGAGKPFLFDVGGWANTVAGFMLVDGSWTNKNSTTFSQQNILKQGKRHSIVIRVRRDRVTALLDGTNLSDYQTDYSKVSMAKDWALNDTKVLGLGSDKNELLFHRVQVVEISGPGTFTRPDDPAARAAESKRSVALLPSEFLAENAWGRFAPGSWVSAKAKITLQGKTTNLTEKATLLEAGPDSWVVEVHNPVNPKPNVSTNKRGSTPILNYASAKEREEALTKVKGTIRLHPDEDLTIAGQKLRTKVFELKRGFQSEKFWLSAEVPGAVCRRRDTSPLGSLEMEVTEFGVNRTGDKLKSLFNGKDLDGWKGDAKYWKVENGEIVGCNVDRAEFVKLSHTKNYRDFRLSFLVRSEPLDHKLPGWGPCLYFHNDGRSAGVLHLSGESHLLAHAADTRTVLARQSADVRAALDKPGYHKFELTATGSQCTIRIDDMLAFDGPCPTISPFGSFYFALANNSKEVRFRDIRIEEIDKSRPSGWRLAFEKQEGAIKPSFISPGKSLDVHWEQRAGTPVLRAVGYGNIPLGSGSQVWKNVHLRFDYRFPKAGASDVNVMFFRNSNKDYFTYFIHSDGKSILTSNLSGNAWADRAEIQGGKVVPIPNAIPVDMRPHNVLERAQRPLGEWNTLELICLGDSAIQRLNGKTIGVFAKCRQMPPDGPVSPRDSGNINISFGGETELRDIKVRDITELPEEVTAAGPWQSLFNGKDLTGWGPVPANVAQVVGDAMEVKSANNVNLPYAEHQGSWGDFHLRFQLKVADVKAPASATINALIGDAQVGFILFLNDAASGMIGGEVRRGAWKDGRIVGEGIHSTSHAYPRPRLIPGQWHRVDYIRLGDSFACLLDDRLIGMVADARVKDPAGKTTDIAKSLCKGLRLGSSHGLTSHFRNIEVREITTLPPDFVEKLAWQSLFNGKNLTGWRNTNPGSGGSLDKVMNVVQEDGGPVMQSAAAPPQALATTEKSYGDVHLRFEFKLANLASNGGVQHNQNSKGSGMGISLSTASANVASWKAKFDVASVKDGQIVAGKPASNSEPNFWRNTFDTPYLPKAGVWHRLELFRLGDACVYLLDGRVLGAITNYRILADGKTPERLERSPISLGTGAGQVSHRNIEIREITALPTEVLERMAWQNPLTLPGSPPPDWRLTSGAASVSDQKPRFEAVWDQGEIVLRGSGYGSVYNLKLLRKNYHLRFECRHLSDETHHVMLKHHNAMNMGFTMYLEGPASKPSRSRSYAFGDYGAEIGQLVGEKIVAKEPWRLLRPNPVLHPPGALKKTGEWNLVELICLDDVSIQKVNGVVVTVLLNQRRKPAEGPETPLTEGTWGLWTQGPSEFRRIEIREISELPQ